MEKGPVTPGLASVIWDAHSFYGSNKSGISLAHAIEDRHGNRIPLFCLRGARLVSFPQVVNTRSTDVITICKENPQNFHCFWLQRGYAVCGESIRLTAESVLGNLLY
eukprot:8424521-Pyramimonas_sp.AAC.1